MSTNPPTLTREQWRTVLDDTDRPTFGELVSTIEAASMIDAEGPGAEQLVDGAVGDLLEADPAHVHCWRCVLMDHGERANGSSARWVVADRRPRMTTAHTIGGGR